MSERERLLALLEVYDHAIEELYVLGDGGLVDFILRLERHRREAVERLAELDDDEVTSGVSRWVAHEIALARTSRHAVGVGRLGAKASPATSPTPGPPFAPSATDAAAAPQPPAA